MLRAMWNEKRASRAVQDQCARELHTVAREDGQCRCGVFFVGPQSDTALVTGDTITDEEICELREEVGSERFERNGQRWSVWQLCMDAMQRPDYQRGDARIRIWTMTHARELCAEIWNDRAALRTKAGAR